MTEAFDLPFMQRALAAGLMVAVLAGYFGAFVVQRGLSFLGNGLAHAAFGGVALGLLVGWQPLVTAVPFTVGVALAITWVRGRTQLGPDTSVGIFFALSMALGIVFLSMRNDYATEAFAYLFGSILAVQTLDLWITGAVLLAAVLTLPIWGRLAYATFDREMARADCVPVERDDYVLSVFIAVTVVVAVKVLGIVLVTAFLVIPAAAARLVSHTFRMMTVFAILIGVFATVAGLLVSYELDVPSGATIILVLAAIFFLAMIFRRS
jgi:zinc transport system permease protein